MHVRPIRTSWHRRGPTLPALVLTALAIPYAFAQAQIVELELDVRDAPRRIYHTRMVLPVEAGSLTLAYPKWIQAEHAPVGPIADLTGLRITAGDRTLPWRRDALEMYEFHVDVPEGVEQIEVTQDLITPAPAGRAIASANLAVILWHENLLYPKGAAIDELVYRPTLILPDNWQDGSSLKVDTRSANRVTYKPVTLERLTDSTLFCGRYTKTYDISPAGGKRHTIFAVAESAAELEMSPEYLAGYKRLIHETQALFGAQPYGDYTFLVALSDHIAHTGLEHHESSDNRILGRSFVDDQLHLSTVRLLPHEYVHSWNGKFRRPADMTRRDLQEPLETELLWVYEGLTRYLDRVLTARSRLYTLEQARENWASGAQIMVNRKGRSWRPLIDTTIAAQTLYGARADGSSWRRRVDFYNEGAFLWLEVDTIIRDRSGGERSLDDFLRRFHGGQNGLSDPLVKSYTLEDVIAALSEVESYDWRTLFDERLHATTADPPFDGLSRSGWRLSYGREPTEIQRASEAAGKNFDLTASIGISITREGGVIETVPDSPCHQAGVAAGMKITAVNGRRFSPQVLKDAIAGSSDPDSRLDLLVENRDFFKTAAVDYHDGAKFYRLARISGRNDLLSAILSPRATTDRAANLAAINDSDFETLKARFQTRLDELRAVQGFPGATAAFILPDGRTAGFATGLADRERGIAMQPDTRMLSGSVGKTFVAAVAIALVQEGKLDLDAKIETWLGSEPWFDRLPGARDITLRMLLTHSSGLPDHVYDPRYAEASRKRRGRLEGNPDTFFPPEFLVSLVLDRESLYPPGKGYRYTDTGYILVGLIIEKVAERTYYEELAARFLEPLKLSLTMPSNRRQIANLAPGYLDPNHPFQLPEKTAEDGVMKFNPATEWTGGGLASNPQDLVRWAQALYEERALEKPYLEELIGSGVSRDGTEQHKYGLGAYIDQTELGTALGHGGWFPGWRTTLRYFPAHHAGVCVQVNTDVNVDVVRATGELAKVLLEN